MSKTYIPAGYKAPLSPYDMQRAIELVKQEFQKKLKDVLNLRRVSAPLFVAKDSGLNDNLNGVERPVEFDIAETGTIAEVVHSLAKWKRLALKKYGFHVGEGLYTDMNAIRRDEELDNTHSIYVDQWDWERIICSEERNIEFLKQIVRRIVDAVCDTNENVQKQFPNLTTEIKREVTFVTSQDLEDKYPELAAREREAVAAKEYGTVFIMQIGGKLRSGNPHDGRAPDYDDWALNGDIIVWNDVLQDAFEISSMGIRVDEKSLAYQLKEAGCEARKNSYFHKLLLNGELPLTVGGGIGQSRLCMLITGTAHIGEVQVSLWDDSTIKKCAEAGISLL